MDPRVKMGLKMAWDELKWGMVGAIVGGVIVMLFLAFMIGVTSGEILPDPTATPIPTLDTGDYDDVITAIGGESNSTTTIDWWTLVTTSNNPYQVIFGNLAFVLMGSIPFVMMWIRQTRTVIPGVMGIIFGGFILHYLPAQWHLGAITAIALSILAIIFSLIKERK